MRKTKWASCFLRWFSTVLPFCFYGSLEVTQAAVHYKQNSLLPSHQLSTASATPPPIHSNYSKQASPNAGSCRCETLSPVPHNAPSYPPDTLSSAPLVCPSDSAGVWRGKKDDSLGTSLPPLSPSPHQPLPIIPGLLASWAQLGWHILSGSLFCIVEYKWLWKWNVFINLLQWRQSRLLVSAEAVKRRMNTSNDISVQAIWASLFLPLTCLFKDSLFWSRLGVFKV